jgi:hypothetical protein
VPSLFTHTPAALPANPPPLSTAGVTFGVGYTAAAFGASVPVDFGSTPAVFISIGQPTTAKPAPTTLATTFAFQPEWHNFERKSCKIALKIAFLKKILLNVQPGAARIAPSSIEKSLYKFLTM